MHNPLRSEADAFRWIVVVGIGAASVILLTLLTRPAVGVAWAAALVGFGAGLAIDLVPPADHEIGRWALVLALIGYAAGLTAGPARRSAFLPVLVVAVAAGASVLMYAGVGALISDPQVTWVAVTELVPTAVLYAVVMSPFVVSTVLALVHRVEPENALAGASAR